MAVVVPHAAALRALHYNHTMWVRVSVNVH